MFSATLLLSFDIEVNFTRPQEWVKTVSDEQTFFFSCRLWRHFRLADCCDKHHPHTSHPRVFLFLFGWQISLSRYTLVACIPLLLWRTPLSEFCVSFLISRDYSWSANCTMGCFLSLYWGRFESSPHSTIGRRLEMCWLEFSSSRLSST